MGDLEARALRLANTQALFRPDSTKIGHSSVDIATQNAQAPLSLMGALASAPCGPSLKRCRWVKVTSPKKHPKARNAKM
jgi:hypothetical protein